jgi:hypothetical protein
MANWLKQSTATTIVIGPLIDDTDGKTAETGMTVSQGDVLLWKEGGTTFGAKNDATSATHRSNGCYTVPLDATDTNTLGQLIVSVNESGALPVRHDFLVVPANVYNSAVLGTDKLQVDAVELNSSATAAAKQEALAAACPYYTVNTTPNTPTNSGALIFWSSDCTEATADHYNGRTVTFVTGALAEQSLSITDYALDGGQGKFTCSVATEIPANANKFTIA